MKRFIQYIDEAQAVSGGKVHKFITGNNLTFRGKKYSKLYFELLRIDNDSKLVTLKILSPKPLFGNEINVPFKTIRRGPFIKTDTSELDETPLQQIIDEVNISEASRVPEYYGVGKRIIKQGGKFKLEIEYDNTPSGIFTVGDEVEILSKIGKSQTIKSIDAKGVTLKDGKTYNPEDLGVDLEDEVGMAEATMSKRKIPVVKNGKVVGEVSIQTQSIGAAKLAGGKSARFGKSKIDGKTVDSWIVTEGKKDYEVYHNTYTSAIDEVRSFVTKNGFILDDEEMFQSVGSGPKKPSDGKTNRFSISLYKNKEDLENKKTQRKALHFQVYGIGSSKRTPAGRYELNMYIS
jgi:hypothetical protein